MVYYAWDDLHLDDALTTEFAYTDTYIKHKDSRRATREVECLKVMVPACMQPVEDGDWFVARRVYHPLGLAPMYWNNETDGLDHVSYFVDLDRIRRVMERPSQTPEQRERIAWLYDFWAKENVNAVVRSRFDETMKRELPSDYWEVDSGVIFCLYRLAGAQLDYDKLLRYGLNGLEEELDQRLEDKTLDEDAVDFLQALKTYIGMLRSILRRYEGDLEAMLEKQPESKQLARMLESVRALQVREPRSFHEGLQLMWLYSTTSGNNEFGRMDEYMGDLYAQDIDNGVITHDEALEMMLSLYKLMMQVHNRDTRIIMGGLGRRNPENADRFSLLAMEASGIHHEAQPQMSLRVHKGMSRAVREAAYDLLQSGLTYPLLYNDDASVPAVMNSMHLDRDEAEQYSFFGCGEYVINHSSMGTPNDIINLAKVLEVTLRNGYDPVGKQEMGLKLGHFRDFKTFDELLEAYKRNTEYFTEIAARHQRLVYDVISERSCMLSMSLLMNDCVAKAMPAIDGGIRYLAGTYETYGNVTTADSLVAIRQLVYEQKRFTQDEMVAMLDANFEGYEAERKLMLACPKFGNDDAIADEMAKIVNDHIFETTAAQAKKNNLASYLVVMINNSANTVLGERTMATADGRPAWTYLSNGNNPMSGMDKAGLTAMLHSLSSTSMEMTAGTTQNIKLSKDLFTKQRDKLDLLLDTIFDMGILSLNVSVLSRNDLEDAMVHPEKYQNLFVRVGGFSQRFILLSPEVQRDVLNRTLY